MAPQPHVDRASDVFSYDYTSFFSSAGGDVFAILEPYSEWHRHAIPEGYYLFGQPMASAPRPHIEVEEGLRGQRVPLLNLASYNYLGLSFRPEVLAAAKQALERYGLGSAGSPLLSGNMAVHRELEEALARFKGKEAALIFATGYATNLGLLQGLVRAGDWVLADQNAHASLVDGTILSKANLRYFRHNNVEDLERKIAGVSGKKLIVVEGVYSMDGDLAPLPAIVAIARRHGARILLDEAHSGFVYGEHGRGAAEHFGLEDEIDISIGTFSKALGGQGGYIACSRSLYDYLKIFARARVFSCALAPVIAAGVLEALRIVEREPALREKLWANVHRFRTALAEHGVDMADSTSQIIPVMIRDDRRVFEIAGKLLERGLYLQPILYPAVAKHRSRFRISVSAAHSPEDIDRAVEILAGVLKEEGILG